MPIEIFNKRVCKSLDYKMIVIQEVAESAQTQRFVGYCPARSRLSLAC